MALINKLSSLFKRKKKPKKAIKKKPAKKPAPQKKAAKKPRIAPSKKKLEIAHRVLTEPHISEKATDLNNQNKYVFKVISNANKTEIKKAIEGLYKVGVKNVNIINVHSKTKILRGIKGSSPGYKKAIVTLEEGEKIEIMPH